MIKVDYSTAYKVQLNIFVTTYQKFLIRKLTLKTQKSATELLELFKFKSLKNTSPDFVMKDNGSSQCVNSQVN